MAAVAGGSHFHQAEFVEPLHDRLGQLCWLDGTAVRITASGVDADFCGQSADVARATRTHAWQGCLECHQSTDESSGWRPCISQRRAAWQAAWLSEREARKGCRVELLHGCLQDMCEPEYLKCTSEKALSLGADGALTVRERPAKRALTPCDRSAADWSKACAFF